MKCTDDLGGKAPLSLTDPQISRLAWLYYEQASRLFRLRQFFRAVVAPMAAVLASIPDNAKTLMDVGTGGALLPLLLLSQRPGLRIYGIDSNSDALAAGRTAWARLQEAGAPAANTSLTLTCSPPEGLRHKVDVVTLVDVLHHVPPRQQKFFVRDAFDFLSPGGMMVVKDMTAPPNVLWSVNQIHDLVFSGQWVYPVSTAQVASWLSDSGAQVVDQKRYVRGVYSHELMRFTTAS